MARTLVPLFRDFDRECGRAIRHGTRTETIALRGGAGSAGQAQDAYATAYLRLFDSWTLFIEGLCLRLMCGYPCGTAVVLRRSRFSTLGLARSEVMGRSTTIFWYVPATVANRFARYFD